MLFTRHMSGILDHDAVCAVAAKLIFETFNVLSVSIWRADERKGRVVCAAPTTQLALDSAGERLWIPLEVRFLQTPPESRCHSILTRPKRNGLRLCAARAGRHFRTGGHRIAVPLCAEG
jgi:hypothetical protein